MSFSILGVAAADAAAAVAAVVADAFCAGCHLPLVS